MKKMFFSLAFLSLSIFLFAQKQLTEFEPIASKPKITALLSNVNDEGILGVSYFFNAKLYWNAIDKEGKVLEKKDLKLGSYRVRPRAAIHSPSHFFHFYENTDNQKIKIIIANKNGSLDKVIEQDLLAKKEKFICKIVDKNEFFLLTFNRKNKQLKLFKFNKEAQKFETKSFELEDYLVQNFYKIKFRAITENGLTNPRKASAFLKGYVLDNQKLLLTIDGEKAKGHGITQFLTLDWETNKIENKLLGKSALWAKGHTNSMFYRGNVYRITSTKSNLNIDIYSFADGLLKKKYHFTKDSAVDILDSPFFSENEGSKGYYLFNPATEKTIVKPTTKKLLKKLEKGSPFIIAESFGENQTLLTIGTYIVSNTGGGFVPGMPGSTVNSPNGAVTFAGTPGTFYGGASYQQSRFFYTKINTDNLEHSIETTDKLKAVHPIQHFVDKTLTKKHVYTVIPYEEKTAVVHYLRSEKRIKVDLFE